MKRSHKRLALPRETVRVLASAQLQMAYGGVNESDEWTGCDSQRCGVSQVVPWQCPAPSRGCAPNPTGTCDGCTLVTF